MSEFSRPQPNGTFADPSVSANVPAKTLVGARAARFTPTPAAPARRPPRAPLATRVKRDPALLQRALADPGLRSKLPANLLSPTQRAARETNAFQADIGDVTTPITGPHAVRAAQQILGSDYAQQGRDLDRQERSVNAESYAQQRWSQAYDQQAQGILGAQGAAQGNANTAAKQAAVDARARMIAGIGGAQQGVDQRATQDAAVRGQGLEGGAGRDTAAATDVAAERAAQQGAAAQQDTQMRGDAQSAFLRGLASVGALRGQEAQGAIRTTASNRLGKVNEVREGLRTDRAGKLSDTLLKLRGNERDSYLAQVGLGNTAQNNQLDYLLGKSSLAQAAKDKAAGRGVTRRGQTLSAAERAADRASREKTAAQRDATTRRGQDIKGSGGGKGRFTTAALRGNAKSRDKAFALATTYATNGVRDPKKLTDALTLKGIDPTLVAGAVDALLRGGVSKANAQAIERKFGIQVPQRYRGK